MSAGAAAGGPGLTRARRLTLSLGIGAAAAVGSLAFGWAFGMPTDLDRLLWAARDLVARHDPYTRFGPGRAHATMFPLLYPLPAVLAVLPLAPLPEPAARAVFVGVSAAVLAYALTAHGTARLRVFLSASYVMALTAAQWSPLFTASLALPGFAVLYAGKPQLGAALLAARPRWVALWLPAAALALSLLVVPGWPSAWLAGLSSAAHFRPLVLHWWVGGPLLLLSLLRWRRSEARLLAALACVPHTTLLYETVPLFLIPQTAAQSAALALGSWVVRLAQPLFALQAQPDMAGGGFATPATFAAFAARVADAVILTMYLPCLVMVLRRPNEGRLPAWLERAAARLPATLRGRPAGDAEAA